MPVSVLNLIDFGHYSLAQVASAIPSNGYPNLLVTLDVADFDEDTLLVKITDDDNADAVYAALTVDGNSAGTPGRHFADFHGGALPSHFSVHVQLGDPGVHVAYSAAGTLY